MVKVIGLLVMMSVCLYGMETQFRLLAVFVWAVILFNKETRQ